jgi:hypothetical protein
MQTIQGGFAKTVNITFQRATVEGNYGEQWKNINLTSSSKNNYGAHEGLLPHFNSP